MKVWHGNNVDAPEYDKSAEELAESFLASKYADYPWPVERALAAHLAIDRGFGWDDRDAFNAVADEILNRRRSSRPTT